MFITLYVGLLLCGKDGRSVHRAGLGGGCIPRRWRPQPPAHPERLHSTGSSASRARCKADHARHDTHARTLDTLHRSALDTRQAAPGRSGRCRGLEGLQRVRQTTLFRMQNIFHANVYKCCLRNLTFPWIHV